MVSPRSRRAKRKRKAVVVEVNDEVEFSDDEILPCANTTKSLHSSPSETLRIRKENSGFSQPRCSPSDDSRSLERELVNRKKAWTKPPSDVQELYFNAAAPRNFCDLSVNPKQLDKLKALFLERESGIGHIILVTGPAGSGKTSSINVIAEFLKFEVVKWERSGNVELVNYAGDSYFKEENELDSLVAFLRSSSLPPERQDRRNRKCRGKIYHIDELPLMAYSDAAEFRRIIEPHLFNNRHIIVFDLTTSESSWYLSPKRVFPSYFINHLCISELEFNPVASTFMRKALRRTLDVLGYRSRMTVHDYRAVEKIANGDLRNAINVLQFSLLCSRNTFSLPDIFENTSNDDLYHMLGSLLYAKRENEGISLPEVEESVRQDLRRPPSTRDVNDVLSMSKASADTVMMFLHEHEPNFTGSIGTLRHVLDSMSISDALSSDWTSRPVAQEYCSQICARATVFHNYGENRPELGFYSYSRPKWFPLTRQIAELRREIRDEMPLSETRCAENDVPYLSLLNSSLSSSQFRLVSYLARPFNFQWTTSREFWDHQLSVDPSYRMVQYRESTSSDVFVGDSQEEDCSGDEETFVIEESDADPDSDGSFDDSVVYS
ncbi:hypothetical protein Q1695_013292 [Nippostrongylus brasiliensis]|nr:hypothetical protein Q1695_013292 [Nippostrongylus brasiliensis]